MVVECLLHVAASLEGMHILTSKCVYTKDFFDRLAPFIRFQVRTSSHLAIYFLVSFVMGLEAHVASEGHKLYIASKWP